jgi:maleate isomerase
LGLEDNFSFAEIPERTIAELVREVVNEGCDAAVIVCTNMRGAGIVNALEIELEVPVYDSISTRCGKAYSWQVWPPLACKAGARCSPTNASRPDISFT